MNVESLLYIYLFVCAGMIVFNIVTAILLRKKDRKIAKVSEGFRRSVVLQLDRVRNGLEVEPAHKQYLARKLKRVGNMIAFDTMLEEMYIDNSLCARKYLSELGGVFVSLTIQYSEKNSTEAAYFPYIIKKYRLLTDNSFPSITGLLMKLLTNPNLYCRENAMQALYTTGDCDCILKALKIIDNSDLFYHDKLLSDGLLQFAGNHRQLDNAIIACFDDFSTDMKVALLNFLRFDSGEYRGFMESLLRDEQQNEEIRYSCIRYFGKYRHQPVYPYLLWLADGNNGLNWEYAAIASSALAIYPGEATVELLKKNLCSPNWYVRFNSSQSLDRLGLTYLDLIDVMEGHDRYAAEIAQYRFDRRKLLEKEAVTQ